MHSERICHGICLCALGTCHTDDILARVLGYVGSGVVNKICFWEVLSRAVASLILWYSGGGVCVKVSLVTVTCVSVCNEDVKYLLECLI